MFVVTSTTVSLEKPRIPPTGLLKLEEIYIKLAPELRITSIQLIFYSLVEQTILTLLCDNASVTFWYMPLIITRSQHTALKYKLNQIEVEC